MFPPWPWLQSPLEMCACDTKQAQGFPAHHNKAQPLDRAMKTRASAPPPQVLLCPRTPLLTHHAKGKSQPQEALLGLSPPQSPLGRYKSFPLTGGSEEAVLQFAQPTHGGDKAIPRAAPHQHTLGAHSRAVNARAASAGLDMRVRRENTPSERKIPSCGVAMGRGDTGSLS